MATRGTLWSTLPALLTALLASVGPAAAEQASPGPDMCLVVTGLSPAAWARVVADATATVAAHPTLFSDPRLVPDPIPPDPQASAPGSDSGTPGALATISVWATGGSGPAATGDPPGPTGQPDVGADCAVEGSGWLVRFERPFLEAGADRMLAEAPTTPGFESSVALEWAPGEDRVRTTLTFSGPFGIPNGTCWIDEVVGSGDAGRATVASATGMQTSPFGDVACGRFFEHLGLGGAAAQAVSLVPVGVDVPGAPSLRFHVTAVDVTDDAILVSGLLGAPAAAGAAESPPPGDEAWSRPSTTTPVVDEMTCSA